MEKAIQRIVKDNQLLDDAEVITASVTREDRTKAHYYIIKQEGHLNNTVEIPMYVFAKENGKGRNRHYVVIASFQDGYALYDLNREREIRMNGRMVVLSSPDEYFYINPDDSVRELIESL